MKGYDEQFVVQAVHMIVDGHRGLAWKNNTNKNNDNDKRISKLVFIGLDLDSVRLESDFTKCQSSS